MNVSCPDCRSIFRVDPAKVPATGVRARCSVCGGVISIPAPTGQNTPPSGSPQVGSSGARPDTHRAAGPLRHLRTPGIRHHSRVPLKAPRRHVLLRLRPRLRPGLLKFPQRPRPRTESVERASVAATATPPSPASGLPEFTPPPAVPPFTPPASSPFKPARSRCAGFIALCAIRASLRPQRRSTGDACAYSGTSTVARTVAGLW